MPDPSPQPKRFVLTPFPGEEPPFDLRIGGTAGRAGDLLVLDCAFLGTLAEIAIPPPAAAPARRGRLFEATCLELFLAERGLAPYREFHLTPAGHWNAYRFTGYRAGMREDPAFSSMPFRVRRKPEALRVSLELPLGGILPAEAPLEAAVCAVVRDASGGRSHWALAHPGPRPDFHRREGFGILLPGR